MNRTARLVAIGCLAVTAVAGCSRTTPGTAAQSEAASSTAESASSFETAATASTEAAAETTSSTEFKLPAYGVEPTTKRPLAAGEVTCEADPPPANPVEVTSAAAGSPTVVLGLPDGFTSSPGQGNVALNLAGPDGLTGSVTIAPTTLDAEAAFEQYGNQRTEKASINSISLLPGDLCGYSGQELIGMLAENPGDGVDYADRIIHVWTNSGDFLVAVQLQGPNGGPGLDPARSVLLADFGIRMPG